MSSHSSPSPSLSQVTWKSKLKAAFPDPNNYSSFMGNFSTATGMVTLLMMLAGRVVFKKFGWGVAAMITPITLLTTGYLLVVLSSLLFYCVVLCCVVLNDSLCVY
jgi:ATP:ADP antiporter, AAA family